MLKSLWYSDRLRSLAAQVALLGGLVALVLWLGNNTATNLAERGIRTGLDFLSRPARFPISESILRYDPSDSFLWAFVVGIGNTLWLSFLTIALATFGGLLLALTRLSGHPLLTRLGRGYVTLFRNIPLIVQLLFFYGVATSVFPAPRDALNPIPGVFLSLRGVYAPALEVAPGSGVFLLLCGAALVAVALALRNRTLRLRTMPVTLRLGLGVVSWVGLCVVLWASMGRPVGLVMPELTGLNFRGGTYLSPEFAAVLIGLVLYTSAFTGEIIRGGIEAMSRGQWEAGRALGLSERQIMFRIILPQALRVIVPPMTSQYLSTVKNTTLAVAVGYPELGLIVNTVTNQTGQALESILIMLAVFLTISLSVSALMNFYNARIALVER